MNGFLVASYMFGFALMLVAAIAWPHTEGNDRIDLAITMALGLTICFLVLATNW